MANDWGAPSPVYVDLLARAKQAAQFAYAPYSHFYVGAALMTSDGAIVTGCNVENASYGLTICAERTALVSAVTQGKKDFQAIAIWADIHHPDNQQPNPAFGVTPCGACRQVLSEFLKPDTPIICPSKSANGMRVFTMADLLPNQFELET